MKAYQLLKNGGILLLTSDNYRSLMSFLCRLIYFLSLKTITYPVERFFIPFNKTYDVESFLNLHSQFTIIARKTADL